MVGGGRICSACRDPSNHTKELSEIVSRRRICSLSVDVDTDRSLPVRVLLYACPLYGLPCTRCHARRMLARQVTKLGARDAYGSAIASHCARSQSDSRHSPSCRDSGRIPRACPTQQARRWHFRGCAVRSLCTHRLCLLFSDLDGSPGLRRGLPPSHVVARPRTG